MAILFREYAFSSLLLLLFLVPFSSTFTFSAIRLPSEAKPCAISSQAIPCPVNCFMTDPVCSDEGVTYWCGCADAHCAGAKVAKIGFCEVGNSGENSSFPGQALLLVHIVWLIVIGFVVLLGFI